MGTAYVAGAPVAMQPVRQGDVVMASGAVPKLVGPDGKPVTSADFRTPIDYGPAQPLAPRISGPMAPREFDYPLGFNLVIQPRTEDGSPSFGVLRFLADFCDYIRIAIEIRKDEIRGKEWAFVPRREGLSRTEQKALAGDIEAATEFWEMPNRIDRMPWHQWIAQVLEEVFVTDATSLHKVRDRVGRLQSLRQIDGATVKPIIDGFGTIIGFQQIIRGYPTTQYTVDDILYPIYNPVVTSVYGTSHTEDIMPTVATLIRKQLYELSYFTDGNVPDAFINAPDGASPEDMEILQTFLDKITSGADGLRHRLRVMPAGSSYAQMKPFQFSREHEQVLLTKVMARFAINKAKFIPETSHTTGKTGGAEARDAGLIPLERFVTNLVNDVTWNELGLAKVKFRIVGDADAVETERSKLIIERVKAGIISTNEARIEDNLDPVEPGANEGPHPVFVTRDTLQAGIFTTNELRAAYSLKPFPKAADVIVATTGFSPTTVQQLSDEAAEPAPDPPAPGAPPPVSGQTPPGAGSAVSPGPQAAAGAPEKPEKTAPEPAAQKADEALSAELAQFRRYALKRIGKSAGGFEAKAIGPGLHAFILAELAGAQTPDAVKAVFDKATRLSASRKARHEKRIADVYQKAFAAEKRRVLATMKPLLERGAA